MATYTNLDNEIFARAALQAFVKTLVPLSAFSRNYSPDAVQRGDTVLVPLISALTATTFGGSYAICGGAKSVVTISINRHKFVPVGQTDLTAASSSEANLEDFGYQQGRALAQAVLEDVFTLLSTSNFALATAVASTALDVPQIRVARLAMNQANVPADPRALILDCVPYDALLGVTNFVQAHMFKDNNVLSEGKVMRALGFGFHEVNSVFGSVNSVMGFAAHASAIAIAMRYLAPQQGHTYNEARAVSDSDTGITMGLRDFYDNATGTRYVALEANYGYSVGLSNGGRLLKRTD
jgi:hypothetical protein